MNWKLLFWATLIAFSLGFARMSWVMMSERTARIEAESRVIDAYVRPNETLQVDSAIIFYTITDSTGQPEDGRIKVRNWPNPKDSI